jgi:Spy/CpxP family protein refolding chaperone
MNVRTLTWIVVVLIVINVAALGTISFQRFAPRPFVGEPPELAGPGVGMMRRLKLSKEQREILFQSRLATDSLLSPIFLRMGENRRMLFSELRNENPDTVIINNLMQEIAANQAMIERKLIDNFLRDSKTLQPEQRETLLRLIEERTMGNEGRRGPAGLGFGRGPQGRK